MGGYWKMKEIKEYFNLIDRKFEEAKEKKISRFNVEWGKWSRQMNLEIKGKLDYTSVFIYWMNRSNLLEALFLGATNSFTKNLEEEGKQIRDDSNSIK